MLGFTQRGEARNFDHAEASEIHKHQGTLRDRLFVLRGDRCRCLGDGAATHARAGSSRAEVFNERGAASRPLPTLKASGRVESVKRTVIECDLENVAVGVRGQRLTSGGAAILLSVIPEGSTVKQGDVLAVIDSSEYEELLRIQEMAVERAAARSCSGFAGSRGRKAGVCVSSKEGTLRETMEDFEGKIFLARSDLERAKDRVAWAHRMKEKGYIPAAALSAEDYKMNQFKVCA